MIFPAVSVSLHSPVCVMTFIITTMRFCTPTIGVWDGFEPKVVTGEDDDEEFTDEEEGKAQAPKVTLHLKRYGIPDLRLFFPPLNHPLHNKLPDSIYKIGQARQG